MMASLTRRGVLAILAAGCVESLAACSSTATRNRVAATSSTPPTSVSSPSPSSPSATVTESASASSGAAATGYQPTGAVLQRISNSGILFDLQGKPGLSDVTGRHAVVVGDEPRPRMQVVVDAADTAWGALKKLVGALPSAPGLVLTPRTDGELQQWSGLTTLISDVWGVTIPGKTSSQLPYVILDCAAPGVTKPHLIDDDLLIKHVVTHELFHAYTLGSDTPVAPLWVVEGFAELAGQDAVALIPTSPPTTPVVPTDEQLRGKDAGDYYFIAWMLVSSLAGRFGTDSAMGFYKQLINSPGTSLEDASGKNFGFPWAKVVAQWKFGYADQLKFVTQGG